jgi:hypothetical protein
MVRPTRATTLGNLPFQVDTTARDYDSIRDALINFLTDVTPEWTDRESSDPGMVLLEAVAYVADVLNYQVDRAQNEMYLSTAQERVNVQQLLRLINYELSTGTASSVPMCVITSQDAVSIPAGTAVTNNAQDARFEFLDDVFLPTAGIYAPSSVRAQVQDRLGMPVTIKEDLVVTYGTTVNESIGVSNGTQYQVFTLSQGPVSLSADLSSSLTLETSSGDVYRPATSFLDADSDTLVYTFQVLSDGRVSLTFGDGVSGKIPAINDELFATYRVGTGAITNSYGINSLVRLTSTIAGVSSVFNPVQPSGGKDAETLRDARINGPRSLRALDRAITLEDFESLALKTPGGGVKVAKAVALEPYDVTVYIAAEGTNPIPSGRWFPRIDTGTGLVGAVGRWLSSKKPVATQLNVMSPVPVTPMLSCVVTCTASILQQEAVRLVKRNLLGLFENSTEMFGTGIPLSRVIQVIENTRGVDFLNIQEFHRDPKPYILKGDDVPLIGATFEVATATTSQRARYRIEWLSTQTFVLYAEGYGYIRESFTSQGRTIFQAGSTSEVFWYASTQSQDQAQRSKQFDLRLVLNNLQRPQIGDVWGFAIDPFVGNLSLADNEIIVPPVALSGLIDSTLISIEAIGGI